MRRRIFLSFLFMLSILISFPLYASENAKEKKLELIFHASPIAYQKIDYWDNDPSVRRSRYGTGAGIGIYTGIDKNKIAGVNVSYEFHTFPDFHSYQDFKVDARIRGMIIPLNREGTDKFNYSIGLGSDFVLRDDGDFGCYAIMIMTGIDFEKQLSKQGSLVAGMDISFSFQTGSHVFHLSPYIGGIYHFDLEKRGN